MMIDVFAFPVGSTWRNQAVDLYMSDTNERIQRQISKLETCLGQLRILKYANIPKIKYEEEYEDEDPSFRGLCQDEQE